MLIDLLITLIGVVILIYGFVKLCPYIGIDGSNPATRYCDQLIKERKKKIKIMRYPSRVHPHCDNKKHDDCLACQTTATLGRLITELDEFIKSNHQQKYEQLRRR